MLYGKVLPITLGVYCSVDEGSFRIVSGKMQDLRNVDGSRKKEPGHFMVGQFGRDVLD